MGALEAILAGLGVMLSQRAKERKADREYAHREALVRIFVDRYTDPELEAEMEKDVLNPEKYNAIWERIENYKSNGGKYCRWEMRSKYSGWNYVGKERRPFRDKRGNLHARSQYDSMMLEGNRNEAVFMLMNTYDKMTVHSATQVARRIPIYQLEQAVRSDWPPI